MGLGDAEVNTDSNMQGGRIRGKASNGFLGLTSMNHE